MPGKTVYYCPGRRFLPVAYKSWSKIIPLEISLQQVTRYLKMFKCQKYLVNLEIKTALVDKRMGTRVNFWLFHSWLFDLGKFI